MCFVFGFRTRPLENMTDEDITISKPDRSKDSIAGGIRKNKYLYNLFIKGIFWRELALISASGRNSRTNFLLEKRTYIGASGNILWSSTKTLSAPPRLFSQSCTNAILMCN